MSPSCDALEQALGLRGLAEQHVERGKVRVPLDRRRHGAEALERLHVQPPDRVRDRTAVVVDEDGVAVGIVDGVTGEVDLTDDGLRQRGEIAERIEADVLLAHVEIVDVAQHATARAPRQLGQEDRLGNRRVRESKIAGRILDQDLPSEPLLRAIDVLDHRRERLWRERERQQVVEIRAAAGAP